jgi:hypothetical protein
LYAVAAASNPIAKTEMSAIDGNSGIVGVGFVF